jgi:ribosomal protein S18 acetylase RimI-like enzyme
MKEADWEHGHQLPDGTRVLVRPLRKDDKDELRRAIQSLSEETTMRRFFRAHLEPSEHVLAQLSDVDQVNHVTIVAMVPTPDMKEERGAGVARFVRIKGQPEVAESAITVVDEYQHRGLGRILLLELVGLAKKHGVTRFRAEVLKDNTAVNSILAQVPHVRVAESDTSATYEIALDDGERSPLYDLFRAIARSIRRVVELTTGVATD